VEDAIFMADKVIVMSPAPMSLMAAFEVDVPRPRDPEFRKSQEFFQLASAVTDAFLGGKNT